MNKQIKNESLVYFSSWQLKIHPEVIKVRVVTIDVSSIGIKFENFMQAG